MTETRTLDVLYSGKPVGRLAEMPDRRIAFQYDNEWIRNGFSINPRSLPLRNNVYIPPENSRDRFGGLFGVFADSLPDSWGQLLLEKHLNSFGIGRDSITTMDRLAYIGCSGMGALEYHPSKESDFTVDAAGLSYDEIASECEKILSSKQSDQLDILYRLGGSSGGARPKVLLSEEGREWIVKFPARGDPNISGKREYDYSLCSKECGIVMTDTALVESDQCEGYFKTERFDRKNGEKVFTVSFAGFLEADFRAPSCDYSTFFKLIRVLTKDNSFDKEQMFRTMCFNVMAHNRDDHAKNFSLLYTHDNGWRLAPAYDLTYSDTYWGEQTTSVNGKGKDITKKDLLAVGMEAGLSQRFCNQCVHEIFEKVQSLGSYFTDVRSGKDQGIPYPDRIREWMEE